MLLALRRVLAIAVLTLPVRSVITNDLGERYTEGLGYAFLGEKEIKAGKGGDEGRVKSIKKNFTKRYPEQQRHKVWAFFAFFFSSSCNYQQLPKNSS